MFEELKTIELSGKVYPVRCDLVVLEKIQNEFGSLDAFEKGIITWEPELDEKGEKVKDTKGNVVNKGKLPDMQTLNTALCLMVNEGEEIQAEKEDRSPFLLSRDEIARRVDISPTKLALLLHDEFYRCFNPKNEKTTQDQTKQKKEINS